MSANQLFKIRRSALALSRNHAFYFINLFNFMACCPREEKTSNFDYFSMVIQKINLNEEIKEKIRKFLSIYKRITKIYFLIEAYLVKVHYICM
jgi:hypothetical protein